MTWGEAGAALVEPISGRRSRLSIQSNRCNGTTVNYLAASERADESLVTQTVIEAALVTRQSLRGGRTWWAHVEFTRISITPTILKKQIEENPDLLDVACVSGRF